MVWWTVSCSSIVTYYRDLFRWWICWTVSCSSIVTYYRDLFSWWFCWTVSCSNITCYRARFSELFKHCRMLRVPMSPAWRQSITFRRCRFKARGISLGHLKTIRGKQECVTNSGDKTLSIVSCVHAALPLAHNVVVKLDWNLFPNISRVCASVVYHPPPPHPTHTHAPAPHLSLIRHTWQSTIYIWMDRILNFKRNKYNYMKKK